MKNKPKVQIGARISMYTKAGLLLRAKMLDITIGDLVANILYDFVEDLTTKKPKMVGLGKTELRSALNPIDIDLRKELEYEKLLLPNKSKKATKQ